MSSDLEAARHAGHWGFRFFPSDAVVLAVLLAWSGWWWRTFPDLAWLPLAVGGHFFVFCNVIRLHRRMELLWAGIFVINGAAWLVWAEVRPGAVLVSQLPFTVAFLVREIRLPRYHGVFADRWNPRLGDHLHRRPF
jgi:hypothetical protein